MQPTQLTENRSDAPSSSSSSTSFDEDAVTASCLIYFVVGITTQEYIGYGSLVNREMILVAREILKDYEKRTMEKELFAHPANVGPDTYIAKVNSISFSSHCRISIARVSKLLRKLY